MCLELVTWYNYFHKFYNTKITSAVGHSISPHSFSNECLTHVKLTSAQRGICSLPVREKVVTRAHGIEPRDSNSDTVQILCVSQLWFLHRMTLFPLNVHNLLGVRGQWHLTSERCRFWSSQPHQSGIEKPSFSWVYRWKSQDRVPGLCCPLCLGQENRAQGVASPGWPWTEEVLVLQGRRCCFQEKTGRDAGQRKTPDVHCRQLVNTLSCQQMRVQLKDNSVFSLGTK